MILDNADDAGLFFPVTESDDPAPLTEESAQSMIKYLPERLDPHKGLIVTTRNRTLGTDLAHGEPCVEVRPFSFQEAEELLSKKLSFETLPIGERNCRKLLQILGCIPLAITQAAAFMKRNRMTISEYHAALEKDERNLIEHLSQELQDARRPRGAPNSIYRTWKISFDYLSIYEPQATRVLSLAATLDHQRIPEIIIRQLVNTDVEYSMAIGTLDGYCLITREFSGETFALHPLVRASLQHWLQQKKEKANFTRLGLHILADIFPYDPFKNRDNCRHLLPHA